MRSMAVLARHLRLLMVDNGRRKLGMKRMLEWSIFVAREAFNGGDLFLMRDIVKLESRMTGHTD